MHDAQVVRRLERVGRLLEDGRRAGRGQGAFLG